VDHESKKGVYALKLNRGSREIVLAWLETAFCRELPDISTDVTRRKLAVSKKRLRESFVERQKLRSDLEIALSKLKQAEEIVLEREVDYELYLEKHPPRKLSLLERLIFWRAAKMHRDEEKELRARAEPVKEARARVDKLNASIAETRTGLNGISAANEEYVADIEEHEHHWIGQVVQEAIELLAIGEYSSAERMLESKLEFDKGRIEFIFLRWLALWFRRLSLEQNCDEGIDEAGRDEELNVISSALHESIADVRSFQEAELAEAMNLVTAEAPVMRGSDFPAVSPANFSNERTHVLFELCKLMAGYRPSIEFPSLPSLASLSKLILMSYDAESGDNRISFGDICSNAIGAFDGSALPSEYARAFSRAMPIAGDTVTALFGHISILSGLASEWTAFLEDAGVRLLPIHHYSLAVLIHAYLARDLDIPDGLLSAFRAGQQDDLLWYTLSACEKLPVYREKMTGSKGGMFVFPEISEV